MKVNIEDSVKVNPEMKVNIYTCQFKINSLAV